CVAWDACLRGLSVALVDQSDFGSATSANSLKIIHGGLRYLQHADFKRMRESTQERGIMMRIAPHLVHPLPVLIPTYGHGLEGKELMRLALAINDVVSFDRNKGGDPQKYIPQGRGISQEEILQTLPGIPRKGLTGGVLFYDAQVYNSERLLLSFLRSSWNAGARVANYVQVTGFLEDKGEVIGVHAQDVLTGDCFDLRARVIINTCGPWINHIESLLDKTPIRQDIPFAKAMNIITKPLFSDHAVGLASRRVYQDQDAVIQKGKRLLFVVPWRGYSMIGTSYTSCNGNPDSRKTSAQEVNKFLSEVNQALPSAELTLNDVSFVHSGLLPSSAGGQHAKDVQLVKHHQIIRHGQQGRRNILSVVGVKYTTARQVAEKVIDQVFEIQGQVSPPSRSSETPIHGGEIEHLEKFVQSETTNLSFNLSGKSIQNLIKNYGSAYSDVAKYIPDRQHTEVEEPWLVQWGEILHGVRSEMAQKLTDVICRRTEIGSAANPGHDMLLRCANIMRAELGWTSNKMQQEIQEVKDVYEWK
ncbi:MAG: glycerol-3-phosphate dehydrogenase/oxidase, partial [Nitrospirales bacterium]